jgi:hypothetical protein
MSLGVGHLGAILDTHISIFPRENPFCEVWGLVGLLMGFVGLCWGFIATCVNKQVFFNVEWFRGFLHTLLELYKREIKCKGET